MLLAVDIGNTLIKTAVFEHNTIIYLDTFNKKDFINSIKSVLNKFSKINSIIASSVNEIQKNDFSSFQKRAEIEFITHNSKLPFQNLYSTPNTMGIDRLVLAGGATLTYPKTNRLIIDVGTCVTYDFVTEDDLYLGGAISPGLRMRYKALHSQTAKLPLLPLKEPENIIGNSTDESIHSGVVNGLVLEIDGFIEAYKKKHPNISIILTGGDTDFLAMRLKNTIFANQNFLLESLNLMHQFNQQ